MSQPKKSSPTSTNTNKQIDYGLLNESLGYNVRRAQIKIFQEFAHFFEALDIKPAQFSAIEIIHRNPGLRQSVLAKALGIQRSNMVGMLDKLQQRNLIERRMSSKDQRAHELSLTSKGEKLLKHLHQQYFQHEESLKNRIGNDQYELVRNSLRIISNSQYLDD